MGVLNQRAWTPTKRRGPIGAEFAGPGPAAVALQSNIGKTGGSLSSSLHYRHHEPKPFVTPAPNSYKMPTSNVVKRNAPSYSLSDRTQLYSDHTQKPGPGKYSPEKVVLNIAPAHTFGMKHSRYTGNLKTGA